MEVHKTKVKTKTKVWNQRMRDKNVVLHEMYTDFRDSDKKVPCSLKFKTDRIQEVIELHKVKFKPDTSLRNPKKFRTLDPFKFSNARFFYPYKQWKNFRTRPCFVR